MQITSNTVFNLYLSHRFFFTLQQATCTGTYENDFGSSKNEDRTRKWNKKIRHPSYMEHKFHIYLFLKLAVTNVIMEKEADRRIQVMKWIIWFNMQCTVSALCVNHIFLFLYTRYSRREVKSCMHVPHFQWIYFIWKTCEKMDFSISRMGLSALIHCCILCISVFI